MYCSVQLDSTFCFFFRTFSGRPVVGYFSEGRRIKQVPAECGQQPLAGEGCPAGCLCWGSTVPCVKATGNSGLWKLSELGVSSMKNCLLNQWDWYKPQSVLQITLEMSTLRSQRIQILQGLQGTGYHRTTTVECLLSYSLNSESFKNCI